MAKLFYGRSILDTGSRNALFPYFSSAGMGRFFYQKSISGFDVGEPFFLSVGKGFVLIRICDHEQSYPFDRSAKGGFTMGLNQLDTLLSPSKKIINYEEE